MIELLLYAPLSVAILFLLYKWITLNHDYFVKRNLPHLEPRFLFGNLTGFLLNRYNPLDFFCEICNKFPDAKIIGLFDSRTPLYIIRHPETVQKLTVKDFDYFQDHRSLVEPSSDKLFGNILIMLRGSRWRDMRATLSPAFTGSKLRQMFDLISECSEDMTAYFLNEAKNKQKLEWEMKHLFIRYTNDVIATCAFGLKINSFTDRMNNFFIIGSNLLEFGNFTSAIRILMLRLFPRLMKMLDIGLFSKSIGTLFRSLVLDAMKVRTEKNIVRPDMINILMQVRSGKTETDETAEESSDGFATVEESDIGKREIKRQWNDDEIVSQCFLFFVAGFITTSTLLSFMAYELAVNPDIQARLYDEVLAISQSIGGKKLNYDALQKLKYMDQVISETLRKWPPTWLTDRLCTRDYIFDDGKGMKFQIEKGKYIWIPILAIHRDPKYYPDPEKFDPERFSDENRKNIVPGSFLGFGNGPRNCIGSRLALLQTKAIYFNILLHFSIEPTAETQIPVKVAKLIATLESERGIHVGFKPRNSI